MLFTNRTNMHPFSSTHPTGLDSHVHLPFKPGPAIADSPTGA